MKKGEKIVNAVKFIVSSMFELPRRQPQSKPVRIEYCSVRNTRETGPAGSPAVVLGLDSSVLARCPALAAAALLTDAPACRRSRPRRARLNGRVVRTNDVD
ncbi:hypothetical protein HPB50_021032 [Hyalomma asiaticum]|uniref:Uncharacterized protein n=1 Tax=Hyalomma asiaticum TaxID=266040 RepID=A0ACB7S8H3_HYAAI|nr:hypothetical protein HPB50_021032 [Hyalomma asiaticum]